MNRGGIAREKGIKGQSNELRMRALLAVGVLTGLLGGDPVKMGLTVGLIVKEFFRGETKDKFENVNTGTEMVSEVLPIVEDGLGVMDKVALGTVAPLQNLLATGNLEVMVATGLLRPILIYAGSAWVALQFGALIGRPVEGMFMASVAAGMLAHDVWELATGVIPLLVSDRNWYNGANYD